jgi:hypothetical protein
VPDRREPEASADRDASLESGELVAQDRDVDLVGGVGSRPEDDPAQELGEHLVDQPQRRRRMMPGRLPWTNGNLTGCARVLGHPQARRTSGLAVAEQAAHHGGYGVRALIRPTAIRSPELDLERSTCRHLTHRQRCPYHIYNVIDRRRGVVQLRSTRIDRTGRIGFGPRASATDGRRQLRAELGSRCRPRAYAASGSPRSFPVHRRCR